jgi:hypothetical protein
MKSALLKISAVFDRSEIYIASLKTLLDIDRRVFVYCILCRQRPRPRPIPVTEVPFFSNGSTAPWVPRPPHCQGFTITLFRHYTR